MTGTTAPTKDPKKTLSEVVDETVDDNPNSLAEGQSHQAVTKLLPVFWSDLANRFRVLTDNGAREPLGAEWCAGGWGPGNWYLRAGRSAAQRERFHALADMGATVLGRLRNEPGQTFWLERLRLGSSHFRGGGRMETFQEGEPDTEVEIGTITDACEASADYCLQCEADAFAEHYGGDRTVPTAPSATGPTTQMVGSTLTRRQKVDYFIEECLRETSIRINKRHIWMVAGHKCPRQFEYWQAGTDRAPRGRRGATLQDDLNFRRILALRPIGFIDLLGKRGILKT